MPPFVSGINFRLLSMTYLARRLLSINHELISPILTHLVL